MSYVYGWRPDLPDPRDKIFAPLRTGRLPKSVDLRSDMPEIWNQGQLGSCSAFCAAGAVEYAAIKEGYERTEPSQLFIYYNERKDEGCIPYDSGSTIRESVKALHTYGACPEEDWPYDIANFTFTPPADAYTDGLKMTALEYQRVLLRYTTTRAVNVDLAIVPMKTAMASGYPVMTGISVFSSFESQQVALTGMIPMPDVTTEQLLGGHAVLLAGYDDENQRFILRNSWGTEWGDHGYGYIPYAYIADPQLGSDFWCVTQVGPASAPS